MMKNVLGLILSLVTVSNGVAAYALGWKATIRDESTKKTKDYFPSIENKSTINVDDLRMVCYAVIQPSPHATKNGVDGQECLTICMLITPPNAQNIPISSAIGTKAVALKPPNRATVVHQKDFIIRCDSLLAGASF